VEDKAMGLNEKLPNQLIHLALKTSEEIVGRDGLVALLRYAKLEKFIDSYPPPDLEMVHPIEDFIKFVGTTIEIFGERGARPILFRGGKRAFEIGLEFFPELHRIDKTISIEGKFEQFVSIYRNAVEASRYIYGDVFNYYEIPEGAVLEIGPCFWCLGLKTQKPICHAQVGFQHGFLQWVLGGEVKVEEVQCIAVGDPVCKFVMHKPAQ
jgi:predicted hydrocarbon binding protein